VKQVSDRRRKRDAVYPARRREVFERGEGMCEFCLIAPMQEVHHLYGRGGPDPHALERLIGLCSVCHQSAHAHPNWAREHGLMRSRHV
jgi:5-methylcytosine-specific restriction endonuclease McrA